MNHSHRMSLLLDKFFFPLLVFLCIGIGIWIPKNGNPIAAGGVIIAATLFLIGWVVKVEALLMALVYWPVTAVIYKFTGGQQHFSFAGFEVDVLFGIAPALILAVIVLRAGFGKVLRKAWTHKSYIAFLLWALGTLIISPKKASGMRLWIELGFPFVVYLSLILTASSFDIINRIKTSMFISGLAVLLLIVMLFVLNSPLVLDYRRGGSILRLQGLFGANQTSFYLLNLVLLAYSLSLYDSKHSIHWKAVAVLFGLPMLLTGTRITLMALLVAFALSNILRSKPLWGVVIPLAVAVLIMFAVPSSFNRLTRKPLSLGDLVNPSSLQRKLDMGTLRGRLGDWQRVAILRFKESPVFGTGLGSTYYSFGKQTVASMHSEYLRLLAETGLGGLLLFIIAIKGFAHKAFVAYKYAGSNTAKSFALAGILSLVGYLVVALTDNPFNYFLFYGTQVWILLALAERANGVFIKKPGPYKRREN